MVPSHRARPPRRRSVVLTALVVAFAGCSNGSAPAPKSPEPKPQPSASAPPQPAPAPAPPKPHAYFATGHGELAEPAHAADGRGVTALRKLVDRTLHFDTPDLPFAAPNGVPSDAVAFVVVGPARAFSPEEVALVKQYVDRGGRLFLALDPEAHVDLAPLAGVVGLTWQPKVLVNARSFAKRRGDDSDRANLVTNRFSDHPSVAALKRDMFHSAVTIPGGAALGATPGTTMKIDFTLLSFMDTFQDDSGDFTFQKGENKTTFNLLAAVTSLPSTGASETTTREMRAIVAGDADFVSDAALTLPPNAALAREALRWLGADIPHP